MLPKSTDELKNELSQAESLETFLKENADNFTDSSFAELLNGMFLKTNLTKAELAKRSGMSEVYLHQLFAGRRTPSRTRLICLCIGMSASMDDTQELLRRSGHAMLYAKSKRDAVIMYGILHEMSLFETNDMLFEAQEDTLV